MINNAKFQVMWVAAGAILAAGCQQQSTPPVVPGEASPVVAQVGDTRISEIDIDYEILSMPESMRHIMQDASARAKVLDIMLKREAVAQKARQMGLGLDPLIEYRMRQAENSVLIQSVKEWQAANFKEPLKGKIEAYYKKHLKDFVTPEQVHARHILVSSKQEALDVLKALKAEPDSFVALAAQYSIDDSNKGRGGDLNWFARGIMVKPFEDVVFAMSKEKRFSQPVKTDFGWHVIEWLGKRESRTPSMEEVSEEIKTILQKERLNEWLQELMDQADIEILKSEYERIN